MAINREDISLLNDLVFQYVFGEREGLPILEAMLNAFFDYCGLPNVSGLHLQDRRLGPRSLTDKGIQLDILAQDATRRLVEIEVQTYRQAMFFERSLYYWSRLYSRQLGRSKKYDRLVPVICVNILGFELIETDAWYTIDRLGHTDHLQIHSIELPKLPSEPLKLAEKWAKFIATERLGSPQAAALAATDAGLSAADRRFREYMSIDARFLEALAREKRLRDERGIMDYAKDQARKEGLAEGRQQTKREIAEALRENGVDEALIRQVTGVD